jgi:hypothetical protein
LALTPRPRQSDTNRNESSNMTAHIVMNKVSEKNESGRA